MEKGMIVYHEGLNKKQKMALYFFIFAHLGWLLETVYALMVHGHFVKRGFLYGVLCPIYGFGAVILIFGLNEVKGNRIMKFFVSMVSFSIFEYAVSYLLEILFGLRWWDYTNEFLNLNGRISIFYSIVWGMIGVMLSEKLYPFIEKQLKRFEKYCPPSVQKTIMIILAVLLIIDTVLSVKRYIM